MVKADLISIMSSAPAFIRLPLKVLQVQPCSRSGHLLWQLCGFWENLWIWLPICWWQFYCVDACQVSSKNVQQNEKNQYAAADAWTPTWFAFLKTCWNFFLCALLQSNLLWFIFSIICSLFTSQRKQKNSHIAVRNGEGVLWGEKNPFLFLLLCLLQSLSKAAGNQWTVGSPEMLTS